jgi:hypothetical protein
MHNMLCGRYHNEQHVVYVYAVHWRSCMQAWHKTFVSHAYLSGPDLPIRGERGGSY